MKSIFERARPLAEKTQRRIAMGIWRYLINSERPYLVRPLTFDEAGDQIAKALGIVRVNHGGDHFRGQSVEQPLGTITRKHGYGLVVPTLVSGYGEAPGQEPRARGVDQPAPTVPATGKHALAAAMLVRHCQNGSNGKGCTSADEPIGTMVTKAEHSLIAASLVGVGGRAGCSPERAVDRPSGVVTTKGDTAITGAVLIKHYGGVVTSQGNKFGLVYAFLTQYYSCGDNAAGLDRPMPVVTTKDRVGLVTVTVDRPDGTSEPAAGVWLKGPDDSEKQLYLIADIGLRMLTPRELARAQGFPDSFVLPPQASKAVRLIGNSVPPPLAEAIVRANFPEGVV